MCYETDAVLILFFKQLHAYRKLSKLYLSRMEYDAVDAGKLYIAEQPANINVIYVKF